ncbi:methyl farnesoate epoxidase-like [Amphiura filiformis]|uniref:methyl farnesoate epoxidase-like n=1 Tax=Amphiura filiformis TaxID=82378 RepID=UPI003B221557
MATIHQLFSAGAETTVTTLRWSLLYMMAYPEIQGRIQREIDDVVGRNRLPNYSDREHLPYTEATLMEIARIASIAPFGIPHVAAQNTTLFGYNIPEETIIMSNIWAIHNDPDTWKDPDMFRPERFLDGDRLAKQPDAYLPFSAGRRVCLGENLARIELFLFFSHCLHRFTFKKPQDSPELSFDGVAGAANSPRFYETEAILRD